MSLFRDVFSTRAVHKRIHDSEEWQIQHCTDDLADSATFVYHIKVGAKASHGNFGVWSEGKVLLELFEAASITADGTAVTGNNLNRETIVAPTLTAFHTPTEDTEGTLLDTTKIGQAASGGIFGAPASGGSVGGDYWWLKPDTSYLVKITNQSGEASDVCFKYEWHEHIAV